MATTQFLTGHPMVPKFWSRKLFQDTLKSTYVNKFMGTNQDALIQVKTETQKSAGDKITYGLRMQLNNAGISGDNTLEGSEESLVVHSDSILIDQIRNGVVNDGRMTDQRVLFSIREEGKNALQDWFSDRLDTAFFNQICGNTAQTDLKYTGHNATVAPDTAHTIWIGGHTTEASIASASASMKMSLNFIDACVERAKTATVKVRPLKVNGDEYYVMFLHPYQAYDLRTTTSTGGWLDIQKAAMMGGQIKDNPIFTGALGVYNNVILHESTRIPSVTSGVYRAVLCGAQAAVMAFGQNNSDQEMTWEEETFDYKNKHGISAGLIYGIKKCVFNSADFGTIVLPTAAAQHPN